MNISDERLQKLVNAVNRLGDEFKAAQEQNIQFSSADRMLREARARGIQFNEEAEEVPVKPNVLIFDIETSLMTAFVWSPGKQYVGPDQIIDDWHMLSWAAKWLFEPDVYSDVLTVEEAKNRDDRRISESLWSFLDKADIIIAHNAKKFDVRKINARLMCHGIKPYSPIRVVDTLQVMRSVALMSSNKQDELCRRFGLTQKMEHEGYNLWKRCYWAEEDALETMERYNKQDVTGLEELYVYIRPWIKSHPNMNLFVEGSGHQCPNCGSQNIKWMDKFYTTPVNKYSTFRCEDCGAIGRSRHSALSSQDKPKISPIAR